jgi:hypothetical protein
LLMPRGSVMCRSEPEQQGIHNRLVVGCNLEAMIASPVPIGKRHCNKLQRHGAAWLRIDKVCRTRRLCVRWICEPSRERSRLAERLSS